MKNTNKTVVALGYFDSVHIGHRSVLKRAREIANEKYATLTVFTFSGNLRGEFLSGDYFLYDDKKRSQIYTDLGADSVCFAPVNKEFLGKSGSEFLDWLNERYDVLAYVCGSDYKFGVNAGSNCSDLIEYAKAKGQSVTVCDIVTVEKEKVSTTLIKRLLKNGEIKKANALLGENYSVSGKVIKGRGDGKKLGYPTANLDTLGVHLQIKQGVYGGSVKVDDKEYKCLINLGKCPTFNQENQTLEVHVLGFSGDLYGEILNVEFTTFLREIKKFNSKEELIKQITEDKGKMTNGK